MHAVPMCKKCHICSHIHNPFHRIERRTGTHLEMTMLAHLGLTLRLGHLGILCNKASTAVNTTMVHINGIQECLISYCNCDSIDERLRSRPGQLLHIGLCAASFKCTQTVFSVVLLKHFHPLSTQSKLTAHNYISFICRVTNYGFLNDSKDWYRKFMMAYRQFCYIRDLRWSNRQADEVLPPGSLAVECPACPQPDINMDPNWRNCPKDQMYVLWSYCGILLQV